MKNSTKILSLILSLLISLSVFNIVPFTVSASVWDSFAEGATPDEAWNVIHTGETKTIKIEKPDEIVYFKFVAEKDTTIKFCTDYVSAATVISFYDNGSTHTSGGWGGNEIKKNVDAGHTYYFAAKYEDETTGSFDVTLDELPVWEYNSYGNGEASLVSYNGRETDVVIPSDFEGAIVTKINGSAFFSQHTLKSIIIPDTVDYIGYSAFWDCGLNSVQLPDGVSTICEQTFGECSSMETVKLPSKLKKIDRLAFENCHSLKEISLPNGLTTIGEEAFLTCRSLSSDLVIPNTVETIGDRAFFNCRSLREVEVGYSVFEIGDYALGYMYKNDSDLGGDFSIVKVDGFTIKGYTGSAAEEYAKENGFDFVSIGQAPPKPTLSFTPKFSYEYVENYYGYWADDLDSEKRSFVYYSPTSFYNGDKLSIDYHDERGIVDYFYDDENESGFINANGDKIFPWDLSRSRGYGWTVGGNNTFTISYKNMSTEVPVSVVKPEDASIRFIPKKPYELIENTEGYPTSAGFIYYEPSLVKGDKLIIDYGDNSVTYTYGSKPDGPIGYNYGFYDEDGQEVPYKVSSDQDNTPWTLGSNNYFILIAAGKTTIVPVTIIEYPVESIEFKLASPIIVYENQDGYYYSEDDTWLKKDENGYYYYNYSKEEPEKTYTEPAGFRYTQIPVYKDGNQLIVHNKDGSTKTLTQRFIFTEEDNGYFFVDENGDYDRNVSFDWDGTSFKLGSDNLLTVKYLDTTTTVPVTVIENNIESIEYQPVTPIVFNLDDPKDVYDWSIGQKLGYYYNEQKMHDTGSVLIARFKDGTAKKYTFYSISNIRDGKYNPVLGSRFYAVDEEGSVIGYSSLLFESDTTVWKPGNTYYMTVSYLGATTQVPIKVIGGESAALVIGDADGNGEVDAVDATLIQRHVTRIKVPYEETQLMNADVDGDGILTIVDATFIQRYSTNVKVPYAIGEEIK